MPDVLHRQAQAVQHDAQAQQVLLGQVHARAADGCNARVHGVAHQHAKHDGQRQRAQAMLLQPVDLAERNGSAGQRRDAGQAGG